MLGYGTTIPTLVETRSIPKILETQAIPKILEIRWAIPKSLEIRWAIPKSLEECQLYFTYVGLWDQNIEKPNGRLNAVLPKVTAKNGR